MPALLAACIVAAATSCATSNDAAPDVSATRCTQLHDHLLELRLNDSRTPEHEREGHKRALLASVAAVSSEGAGGADGTGGGTGGFVQRCVNSFGAQEVDCSLKAKDLAAARACGELVP
jgi:hypothetical protein